MFLHVFALIFEGYIQLGKKLGDNLSRSLHYIALQSLNKELFMNRSLYYCFPELGRLPHITGDSLQGHSDASSLL